MKSIYIKMYFKISKEKRKINKETKAARITL